MKELQVTKLFKEFDKLQSTHGDKKLLSVYGAGCKKRPKLFLLFMNPTGRNVSCIKGRQGIRAPRLGTKNIRKILFAIGTISKKTFEHIQKLKPNERTEKFSLEIYQEIAESNVYISNLAKCTQTDARPLKDSVFKEYLDLIYEEINEAQPEHIVSFGNQVSSIILSKKITVSGYIKDKHEILQVRKKSYKVYPTFYPVGLGMRNMPKAIERIKNILKK
ncbi:MAG: hypothetical protein NTY80_02540 [candidate division SR1 bacterium]|nr:hypothetical protein [candidate division SR1 bacterium]